MSRLNVNFYSPMKDASGMLLETEIYLNKRFEEIQELLIYYRSKYPEYDWLEFEINDYDGYCLYGYIKGRVEGV